MWPVVTESNYTAVVPMVVTMSCPDASGTPLYTIDTTVPDEHNVIAYTAPLVLQPGSVVIRAVCNGSGYDALSRETMRAFVVFGFIRPVVSFPLNGTVFTRPPANVSFTSPDGFPIQYSFALNVPPGSWQQYIQPLQIYTTTVLYVQAFKPYYVPQAPQRFEFILNATLAIDGTNIGNDPGQYLEGVPLTSIVPPSVLGPLVLAACVCVIVYLCRRCTQQQYVDLKREEFRAAGLLED
eukprot:TRINITY_DN1226_c0_g1_i6.p1 TRINITY_DN1226_c0_g1~~TRINITY_DN1226_c0_g1_i6.p1  ORF type:complete len:238 (+),score=41.57 TRINITY_DN1226_c0_g1_i6:378-1091(+)